VSPSLGLQGAKAVRRGSVLQTKSQGAMKLLCYYKTAAPPGSTSPVWNEETFVTGATWNSQLVLTYFDANKLGQDTCLGQVGIMTY
jgi:Ca2+-dependent lipid-binding protein